MAIILQSIIHNMKKTILLLTLFISTFSLSAQTGAPNNGVAVPNSKGDLIYIDTSVNVWKSLNDGGSYAPNSIINHDGTLYKSTSGVNTNTAPNLDTTNWKEVSGGGLPDANHVHVSTVGSDTTGNGSSSTPFATLTHALTQVTSTGMVEMATGSYTGAIALNNISNIALKGSATGKTEIVGGVTLSGNTATTLIQDLNIKANSGTPNIDISSTAIASLMI